MKDDTRLGVKNENKNDAPECFGKIEVVFPRRDDGLRHSPGSCMQCMLKTECLRKAMNGQGGLKVKEELTNSAYKSGSIGFFKRWSRKKELSRDKKPPLHD